MKKSLILTLCLLLISLATFAGKFILIPITATHHLESLFNTNDLKIHYYNDHYVLATAAVVHYDDAVVLDDNAFGDVDSYAIVYCDNAVKDDYLTKIAGSAAILFSGENFLIMKLLSEGFVPAKNDGMVVIRNTEAKLTKSRFVFPVISEPDETILDLLAQVSQEKLIATVQHLEDYGTRFCSHPTSTLAQNWIQNQYNELSGLDVFIHNFSHNPWWGGTNVSNNVIAIQYGTEFPDEFIVCGGHYDSFSRNPTTYQLYFEDAPGADDNATGIAGVYETARILSQYDFKRSIIYCSFSAEECGLNGSDYYALQCANQGMNIIGYFNIDMSGYLQPGSDMHIDLIYPNSAAPLANYYLNIADVYYNGLPIASFAGLPGGDSDHTSFNKYGFMGIFPFEDRINYTPHIHTPGDIIGQSVNNWEQVEVFTKLNLAGIATLALMDIANPPPPILHPVNCVAEYIENEGVQVTWLQNPEASTIPDKYYVYKDDVKVIETEELSYLDDVKDYELHCYKVTAIYIVEDEALESDFSNQSCDSVPFINNVIQYNSNYQIYPNPTNGELKIECDKLRLPGAELQVEIFDVFGRKKSSHHLITSSVDVSHLSIGIYFIKIENEFIGKFIKE